MLLLCALLWLLPAARAAAASDEYLAGYISSVLERELRWPRGSYDVRVVRGIATVTLLPDDQDRRAQASDALKNIEGLQALEFAAAPAGTESAAGVRAFPAGELFRPLLADLREPRFFASLREYDLPAGRLNAIAIGYGENFGLYRFPDRDAANGFQASVGGSLSALFNLDEPSTELINADYSIGLPLTWRRGDTSARLRLYHQSSHLGDGYLLRVKPQHLLLYYESVSLLVSQEWQGVRAYLGGEYLFHREPDTLEPGVLQGGLEYYGTRRLWGDMRWLAGVDFRSEQQHDYDVDTSIQIGLEAGGVDPGQRRVRVVLEGFRGYSPHGQFFVDRIAFYGLGVYFGF